LSEPASELANSRRRVETSVTYPLTNAIRWLRQSALFVACRALRRRLASDRVLRPGLLAVASVRAVRRVPRVATPPGQ
jgi:hypothetical protein